MHARLLIGVLSSSRIRVKTGKKNSPTLVQRNYDCSGVCAMPSPLTPLVQMVP